MLENNLEYLMCASCYRVYEAEDIDDDNNCLSCARKLQKKNRKQMIDINLVKTFKKNYKNK